MNNDQKPTVTTMDIDKVIKAEWNYKTDGSDEQIEKLMNSIKFDHSAGVLAVRKLKSGDYEVIDGNHRLEALKRLGWKSIPVENFGAISKAKAVTIARRRNHSWFEDDLFKLGTLYKDVVMPELGRNILDEILPDAEDLDNIINLGSFEWQAPEKKAKTESDAELDDTENFEGVSGLVDLKVSKETKTLLDDMQVEYDCNSIDELVTYLAHKAGYVE